MEKIETHLVEEETHVYSTKVDVKKAGDDVIGVKITCYDRVVDCDFSEEPPSILVRRLNEDDRRAILKKGFANVHKKWTYGELKDLEKRYTEDNQSIDYISTILERTGFSIFLQLKKMGHIPEEEKFKPSV